VSKSIFNERKIMSEMVFDDFDYDRPSDSCESSERTSENVGSPSPSLQQTTLLAELLQWCEKRMIDCRAIADPDDAFSCQLADVSFNCFLDIQDKVASMKELAQQEHNIGSTKFPSLLECLEELPASSDSECVARNMWLIIRRKLLSGV
jgi:hypothetical protein